MSRLFQAGINLTLESCTENVLPLVEVYSTTQAKIVRRIHISMPYPYGYLPSGKMGSWGDRKGKR